VLVHGTFSWGTLTFSGQRPLAASRRLLVPDRRGFGASPGSSSDYAVDAVDVVALLGDGAHLVGHSYGGTVAMLAAAARPDLVRSLTLIEPCAHQVAADVPVVARAVEDGRRFMDSARRGTAEEYIGTAYGNRPRPKPAALVPGAAHDAQASHPAVVNALLADLWS